MQVISFINFKLHGSKNTCQMLPFQAPSKVNLMYAARTIFLFAVKEQLPAQLGHYHHIEIQWRTYKEKYSLKRI